MDVPKQFIMLNLNYIYIISCNLRLEVPFTLRIVKHFWPNFLLKQKESSKTITTMSFRHSHALLLKIKSGIFLEHPANFKTYSKSYQSQKLVPGSVVDSPGYIHSKSGLDDFLRHRSSLSQDIFSLMQKQLEVILQHALYSRPSFKNF